MERIAGGCLAARTTTRAARACSPFGDDSPEAAPRRRRGVAGSALLAESVRWRPQRRRRVGGCGWALGVQWRQPAALTMPATGAGRRCWPGRGSCRAVARVCRAPLQSARGAGRQRPGVALGCAVTALGGGQQAAGVVRRRLRGFEISAAERRGSSWETWGCCGPVVGAGGCALWATATCLGPSRAGTRWGRRPRCCR